jgi:hypothetical protein
MVQQLLQSTKTVESTSSNVQTAVLFTPNRLAIDSKLRHREHLLSYKNGDNKSTFAKHQVKSDHNMGKMEDIIKLIYKKKKSRHLDIMEKYCIQGVPGGMCQTSGERSLG